MEVHVQPQLAPQRLRHLGDRHQRRHIGGCRLGWYDNPKMAQLRDQWFVAADVPAQQAVCQAMQREAVDNPPFIPLGQWKQPWGFRTSLKNFVECGNVLFWGVERA